MNNLNQNFNSWVEGHTTCAVVLHTGAAVLHPAA
jgi:hypothetical protein